MSKRLGVEMKTGMLLLALAAVVPFVAVRMLPAPKTGYNPPMSLAKNVAAAMPTVVHVSKEGVCEGSGVILSADGIIMTARHISKGTTGTYIVTLNDGTRLESTNVVEDVQNDLAYIKVEPDRPLPFAMLCKHDPRPGDRVLILGSPLGFRHFNSVTMGIVSANGRQLGGSHDWVNMVQSDAAAYPGNSGGPVFDTEGSLIGVLVGGYYSSLNFSVPVCRFRGELDVVRIKLALSRYEVVDYGTMFMNTLQDEFPVVGVR